MDFSIVPHQNKLVFFFFKFDFLQILDLVYRVPDESNNKTDSITLKRKRIKDKILVKK